jgi:predicted nucleic acid-binding protein
VIVLDTNVLAELMRQPAQRDPHVVRFVSDAPLETLFIPSIAVAEVRYGIARLPVGHRRATLQAIWSRILADGFEGSVRGGGGNWEPVRASLGRSPDLLAKVELRGFNLTGEPDDR